MISLTIVRRIISEAQRRVVTTKNSSDTTLIKHNDDHESLKPSMFAIYYSAQKTDKASRTMKNPSYSDICRKWEVEAEIKGGNL